MVYFGSTNWTPILNNKSLVFLWFLIMKKGNTYNYKEFQNKKWYGTGAENRAIVYNIEIWFFSE